MPKVSVVVPVYNCGEFLDELIVSMKAQTLSDFEVIFVDDGSKDNSAEVINKHLPEDSRFRYIYQENQFYCCRVLCRLLLSDHGMPCHSL